MEFTNSELALIQAAITKGGDIWNDTTLDIIKQRIKTHYRNGTDGHCCYCRRRFRGEFKMDIDIEHVLPKSKFVDFMFEMFNLNISCKRCNMWIKKERTDFLVDITTIVDNVLQSDQYYLIHPNFDSYFDNMDYDVVIKNEVEIVKFTPKRQKGKYTYVFFKLSDIEINTLNEAQGINNEQVEEILPGLPIYIKNEAERLVEGL